MSKWKFSKSELANVEKLELREFLEGYELKVAEMMAQLSKIVESATTTSEPLSQRSLYILRQLTVNVDHFSLIFRRKSIEFMKQEEERLKQEKAKK